MSPTLLGEWLGRLGPTLTLLARQYTLLAEDAVQEAFIQLAGLREPPSNIEAWLFRTVRHRALDLRKTEARRKRREETHRPNAWFAESKIDDLDAETAINALQRLPEEEREIIVARLWGTLTLAEIASAFDCSVATAHRRYESGVARLRELLREPCPNQTIR